MDLNWSPDDSTLASGSLDNTIHIWSMTNGICTAVLRGHSSLVKGVTWDPIGSFIASQSDDKTVVIWRTTDWSLAHRTEGHWAKSVSSLSCYYTLFVPEIRVSIFFHSFIALNIFLIEGFCFSLDLPSLGGLDGHLAAIL